MRITLDANILVRANAKASGPAKRLLEFVESHPEHTLVLSRHMLNEVKRALAYPRLRTCYHLSEQDIQEHLNFLDQIAEIVEPLLGEPVVLGDPDDDLVLYTAVDGRADVLCALDRDFYALPVREFCRQRGIEIMNDVELLGKLRTYGR